MTNLLWMACVYVNNCGDKEKESELCELIIICHVQLQHHVAL